MSMIPGAPDKKDVVRRYIEEVVNRGRWKLIEMLVSHDHVFHCPDGDLYGQQGARLNLLEMQNAFLDLHIDITELIGEGELVARRFVLRGIHIGPFMGLEPSFAQVAIPGLGHDRVGLDGRIAETWIAFNTSLPAASQVT